MPWSNLFLFLICKESKFSHKSFNRTYTPFQSSMNSFIRSPYHDNLNSRFSTLQHRFQDLGAPLKSFSGSISFDVLCNQVPAGSKSYNSTFYLFENVFKLLDSNYAFVKGLSFNIRTIVQVTVDTTVSPALVSNRIRFLVILNAGGVKKNQYIDFDINSSGTCVSDTDFEASTSNSSVSQKMKDLNFFQIVKKMTIFYKVLD